MADQSKDKQQPEKKGPEVLRLWVEKKQDGQVAIMGDEMSLAKLAAAVALAIKRKPEDGTALIVIQGDKKPKGNACLIVVTD